MSAVYMLPSLVTDVVVYSVWLSAVLFDVLYTLKAPWWASMMGWNLFALDFCVALAVTPGCLARLDIVNPDSAFFQWFVVGDLLLVSLVLVHRIYLLLRAQEGWNFWGPEREAHDHNDG